MTKNGYILSIDQGTTSSRAALISEDGKYHFSKKYRI
jgi:glycerol kinase